MTKKQATAVGSCGGLQVAKEQKRDLEEKKLLVRCQQGCQDAWSDLQRRYAPQVQQIARRILGRRDGIDDVVQEVFTNVFRGLKCFKGDSSFKTWLYRIAVNATREWLRKETRHDHICLSPSNDLKSKSSDSSEIAETREVSAKLSSMINSLESDIMRKVLALRLGGMTYREISLELDITENSVTHILHNVRVQLRKMAKEEGVL